MKRVLVVLSSIGLMALALASPANAQTNTTWDDKAYLTFSSPVSLPGVTLPAGRYLFRFPSRYTARSVIQVLSGDRRTVYAMVQTVPTWRLVATHDPEVTFKETPANAPPPIAALFRPHDRIGYEFPYTNRAATQVATAGTN